jgi:hypothetical protein
MIAPSAPVDEPLIRRAFYRRYKSVPPSHLINTWRSAK